METKKIAVIGTGNMGAALLRGMLKAHWAKPENLLATHPRESRRAELAQELGIRVSGSNLEGAQFADILVLGIKPQILKKVLTEIAPVITPRTLVVSIAAGVSTKSMEDVLRPGVPVIRSMPNLGVTVGLGATAFCRGQGAREEHAASAKAIFEAVGMAIEVDEYQMDAVTGLSGTGPMYIFQILEGLADAGVKVGLSRHVATQLAMHTVLGSAKMAVETGKHPAMLKDMVTSPGGTAITALHSMERNGLRALLIDAVEAATKRSKELGELQNR
ncbi:MAG TPA: pyrroline-5-carboxylate reductase [Candidatus Thermoplasmatota archaeon]|nr:pyrroline-5-carboxylate reductase [Candidatus Thermoplasmatota archaeon]